MHSQQQANRATVHPYGQRNLSLTLGFVHTRFAGTVHRMNDGSSSIRFVAKKTNEQATPPGQMRKDRSLVTKLKLLLQMNTLMMDVHAHTVPC